MTTFAPPPPNEDYQISPTTFTPEPMQYDLSKVPVDKVCPADGGVLVRIGSNDYSLRCAQCGAMAKFV